MATDADPTVASVATAGVRFRAMGCDAHVLVTGPHGPALLDEAQARIAELERLWSRFRCESDVSRLNAAAGGATATVVADETRALLERATLGWLATDGAWNPLMGRRIVELGYDRSFTSDMASLSEPSPIAAVPFRGVQVDDVAGTARLPEGVALDVGGIAKGFAADLVTGELLRAGAWGAMVNIGGDLRVRGLPPAGIDWTITVREPALGLDELTTIALPGGGVATSTTSRRRWAGPDGDRHHLLDPATGLPATGDVVLATVVAGEAWWAEVAATARCVRPSVPLIGCASLELRADGTERRRDAFDVYERTIS